jgi:hypothetical protein
MDFPVKETIGAAVTLAVAAIGYRQWLRTRRGGQFIADRETAYKAVWSALEEANLRVRGNAQLTPSSFDDLERSLNALLMQHSLHLDGADKVAAHRYVKAILALGRLLTTVQENATSEELRRALYTTEAGMSAQEFMPIMTELDASRTAVIERFRAALGAGYA